MKDFTRNQLPVILWALLIFIVSSIPKLPTPTVGFRPVDKLAHFVEFFIFGILLANAFVHRSRKKRLMLRLLMAGAVGVVYGISDELHQSFVPGREAAVDDVIADAVGVIAAQIVFFYRSRLRGEGPYPQTVCLEESDAEEN